MSKLHSISIVISGLLLALLVVSCDWANPQAPSVESGGAGNNKNGKTSPGPSTEEPARKTEELAQEPADNHQEYAAKPEKFSQQIKKPATSSQEAITKTETDPASKYKQVKSPAHELAPLKQDAEAKLAAQPKAPDALSSALKEQVQESSPGESVKKVEAATVAQRSQASARPDPCTEEDLSNNDTEVLEEEVTDLGVSLDDVAQKALEANPKEAPASLNQYTEEKAADLNNQEEEKVTHLNERLSDANKEVKEVASRVQEIALNSLTEKSKKELNGLLQKKLPDLQKKLVEVERLNTSSKEVDELKTQVKTLENEILAILERLKRQRGWK